MLKNYTPYTFLFFSILVLNQLYSQGNIPPPIYYDLGDAPNSYITDRESKGPIHVKHYGMPDIRIGQLIDYEYNTSPSIRADGDDLGGSQDEDAINPSDLNSINIHTDEFIINVNYSNSASMNANLYAWIDFDRSGFFDEDEFTSVLDLIPGEGVSTLKWSNLKANGVDIVQGVSYARFRITIAQLTPNDVGGNVFLGEIEDYSFAIGESTLGIKDELLSEGLKLYPNPVADILTVESQLPLVRVEIYNILGQEVIQVNSNYETININELSQGIYLIKISSENGSTVRKLIKQ